MFNRKNTSSNGPCWNFLMKTWRCLNSCQILIDNPPPPPSVYLVHSTTNEAEKHGASWVLGLDRWDSKNPPGGGDQSFFIGISVKRFGQLKQCDQGDWLVVIWDRIIAWSYMRWNTNQFWDYHNKLCSWTLSFPDKEAGFSHNFLCFLCYECLAVWPSPLRFTHHRLPFFNGTALLRKSAPRSARSTMRWLRRETSRGFWTPWRMLTLYPQEGWKHSVGAKIYSQ